MKLRDLKEWLDSKPDSELDEEVMVSDRMWADDERDIYEIVKVGWQSTDEYKGYVFLTLSKQVIEILEEKHKLKKKLEECNNV